MSQVAIRVEGLGKKYLLRHQRQGRRYVALRDVLAEKFKGLFRNPRSAIANPQREEFWALKDISFEIQRGEAVGIIGRNGAGKSTLLKLLSRITQPSAGRIEIEGHLASLLEVGTGFHPELTGRENIYLNGAILGMPRVEIKRKFDEIVAFADVEKFLDTPVKRYSSGMYMRLAFAVAANLEPEILVIDEVLAVGDADFQKKCLGKMDQVSKSGRTVLFVSHNLDSILRLCTRAIWLDAGSVKTTGNPSQVINAYLQHRQSQSGTVDLRAMARTCSEVLRGKARFLQIISPSTVDGAAWSYPFGSDLVYHCVVEVSRKFSHFSLVFALHSGTGFEIASAPNYVGSVEEPLFPGRYRFAITVPGLRLAPGSYAIDLGIRSEGGVEDYILGATTFDVITNELAAAALADTIAAAIIPETRCSFVKID